MGFNGLKWVVCFKNIKGNNLFVNFVVKVFFHISYMSIFDSEFSFLHRDDMFKRLFLAFAYVSNIRRCMSIYNISSSNSKKYSPQIYFTVRN